MEYRGYTIAKTAGIYYLIDGAFTLCTSVEMCMWWIDLKAENYETKSHL